jgi:hypothetical protein
MEHPQTNPPLAGEYYRRHAARMRRLAREATTPAIREHLQDVAAKCERLAERVAFSAQAEDDPKE